MAYNYDKLFEKTPRALGEPTQKFVDFFREFKTENARVLDVGCGQGRDALFIARLGHRVVGVDMSPHGIRDMAASARREKLPVQGVVADVITYVPDGLFDVVLIDRTLHMLTVSDRLAVLARLLDHVAEGGWVLIADEASNIAGFNDVLDNHRLKWLPGKSGRGYLFAHF